MSHHVNRIDVWKDIAQHMPMIAMQESSIEYVGAGNLTILDSVPGVRDVATSATRRHCRIAILA